MQTDKYGSKISKCTTFYYLLQHVLHLFIQIVHGCKRLDMVVKGCRMFHILVQQCTWVYKIKYDCTLLYKDAKAAFLLCLCE